MPGQQGGLDGWDSLGLYLSAQWDSVGSCCFSPPPSSRSPFFLLIDPYLPHGFRAGGRLMHFHDKLINPVCLCLSPILSLSLHPCVMAFSVSLSHLAHNNRTIFSTSILCCEAVVACHLHHHAHTLFHTASATTTTTLHWCFSPPYLPPALHTHATTT